MKVANLNADLLDGMNASDFSVAGHNHDDRYYTKSELSGAGTINDPSNPVDWTKLNNVPAGFADGVDDTGPTYAAGDGIAITGNATNPVIGVADASVTARKLQTPYTGLVSSTSDVSFRTQFLYATGGTTQARVVVGVNGAFEGGYGTATVVYNGATIATFALPAGGFRTDTFVSPAFTIGSGGALDVLIRANSSAAPVIVRNVDVLYS